MNSCSRMLPTTGCQNSDCGLQCFHLSVMLQNMITFLPEVQAHQEAPELPSVPVHSVSTPRTLPPSLCPPAESHRALPQGWKRDQVIPHLGNVPDNILLKGFSPGPWLPQHRWSFGKLHVFTEQRLVARWGKNPCIFSTIQNFDPVLSFHLVALPPDFQCLLGGCGVCWACLCLNKIDFDWVTFNFYINLSLLE